MAKQKKTVGVIKANNSVTDSGLKSSLDFTKTPADKFAVLLVQALGSIKFLLFCMLIFALWICWNLGFFHPLKPFDPFPFPILEMAVSLFAIILSVSVIINQNRQGRIEKIQEQVEFEVNVRAEEEVTKMLNMLHEIHQKLGLNSKTDAELEAMKAPTDINQIHHSLDETAGSDKTKVS
ncbi:MAG: DUF1003 domain-containing protein [Bacteroidota bacterium]|nr:DUF1003 domain-containing protein [Bacteroidota bacterium]